MYQSEKVFIKKFLACLSRLGINEIPYDDNRFYSGIENMSRYYNDNKEYLGKYKDEIGMLFIRYSIDGIFAEFKNEISSQNGKLMTFENPLYIKAYIRLDDVGCDYILKHGDIDNEYMMKFAYKFCEGAKLLPSSAEPV